MSLFDKLFKRAPAPVGRFHGSFRMLNGYTPHFTTFAGSIYEQELIRACIDARARHVGKLAVEIQGTAHPTLRSKLKHGPNEFQTWGQFLYRLSTILDVHNTAFITPVFDEYGQVSGIFSPLPDRCEIVEYGETPYLRYEFNGGHHAAIELNRCGVMLKHQYRNDFFGESNRALFSTIDLIHIQNQGIQEGVKSSASYRFWAKAGNFTKIEDLAEERKRFTAENFSEEAEGGGMLLFPHTYTDIHQVDAKPWVVDADQMAAIRANAFEYFGVNEDVLQNKAYGDGWSAFYEGAVETFAIQFSDVCSKMLFTLRERTEGNRVMATSNRLQYMSNADKLNVSAQMADRGLMTRNEIRQIWNLPPLDPPYGDQLPVRGEYYNVQEGNDEEGNQSV